MPKPQSKIVFITATEFNNTISPEEFKQNLVVGKPYYIKYSAGPVCYSDIKYRNQRGDLCNLYLQLADQKTFGPSAQYPYGIDSDEDKTDDKLTGYQIQYPLTSLTTVNEPTEAESNSREMLDIIHEKIVERCEEEYQVALAQSKENQEAKKTKKPQKQLHIPEPAFSSMLRSHQLCGSVEDAVKPIYTYPKHEVGGEKEDDTSKPPRFYSKLFTRGKGTEMQVLTKFYKPAEDEDGEEIVDEEGNVSWEPASPLEFLGTLGTITPAFKPDRVFYGAHGSSSPFGISLQLKLQEANFRISEASNSFLNERLMAKPSTKNEDSEDDDGFKVGTGISEIEPETIEFEPAEAEQPKEKPTKRKTAKKVAKKNE